MIASGTRARDDTPVRPSDGAFLALVSGRRRGPWPALQRLGLEALSLPYGWAVRWRNRLYDCGWKACRRVAVPVVSVGNLTLGGTGKTPCVEYLARYFCEHQRRPAILSRGYGSDNGPNDEALVLEENIPDVVHLQGADRVALAAIAVEELKRDLLILDDGFQHRRLARDLDVVLIDATQPWGFGRLFPRGLLRETPAGLRRAGMVLITRCDQAALASRSRLLQEVRHLAPGVPIVETRHRPLELVHARAAAPLDRLVDRPVAAFCGIGNPEAFRRTLAGQGAEMIAFRTFADHHVYTRMDVEELRSWAGLLPPESVVVTTQKDLVKLRLDRLGDKELWALRIGLHVEAGQEGLDHKLRQVLSLHEGEG